MLAWVLGIILVTNGEALAQQTLDSAEVRRDTLDSRILHVDRVFILGNKVTRERIIERELSLKPGDSIRASELQGTLLWDKNKLYNLRLFNTVSVRALELGNNHIDLLVELTERWYIFPVPIFELSDRNFNEWWNNYNHDLTRINYGIRVYKNNFRGRNESLRFTAQFGFNRKFDLQYKIPNLDRKQKQGLTFNFDFGAPRNMSYQTLDHRLLFLRKESVVRESAGAGVTYTYRKTFFETHAFSLSYRNASVIDTVLQLNPIYYNNSKTRQRYFQLSYYFVSEHRDVVMYPLKGYQLTGYVSKTGLLPDDDVSQLEANITYSTHHQIGKNLYLSNFSSLFWSAPRNQPYTLFEALGYRNLIVRGFENYVIEGPSSAVNKTTLKKKIFGKSWTIDQMPLEQFNYFPLAIYVKLFADIGYIENYPYYQERSLNTRLSNQLLAGAGGGLDFVTVYDLVIRMEYTFTQDGQRGFFLNMKKEF
ncbi:MAG: POTRA domain-containing protein [Cytophagales bacterium]|nr:POTRA domain-containing protein [Cytophagales bacterium]